MPANWVHSCRILNSLLIIGLDPLNSAFMSPRNVIRPASARGRCLAPYCRLSILLLSANDRDAFALLKMIGKTRLQVALLCWRCDGNTRGGSNCLKCAGLFGNLVSSAKQRSPQLQLRAMLPTCSPDSGALRVTNSHGSRKKRQISGVKMRWGAKVEVLPIKQKKRLSGLSSCSLSFTVCKSTLHLAQRFPFALWCISKKFLCKYWGLLR